MTLNKSLMNYCTCPFYRGSCFLTFNCLVKEIYTQFIVKGFFSFYGAKARSMSGPPYYRGLTVSLRHATLLGLLWSGDLPHAETTTYHTAQNSKEIGIRAPGGIRTRSPRNRVATDRRLIPRGHRNRRDVSLLIIIFTISYQNVIYILFCLVRLNSIRNNAIICLSRVSFKLVSFAL
jgi:hypothetical protein